MYSNLEACRGVYGSLSKKRRNPERLNHKKISVKIFNLAATFI